MDEDGYYLGYGGVPEEYETKDYGAVSKEMLSKLNRVADILGTGDYPHLISGMVAC